MIPPTSIVSNWPNEWVRGSSPYFLSPFGPLFTLGAFLVFFGMAAPSSAQDLQNVRPVGLLIPLTGERQIDHNPRGTMASRADTAAFP